MQQHLLTRKHGFRWRNTLQRGNKIFILAALVFVGCQHATEVETRVAAAPESNPIIFTDIPVDEIEYPLSEGPIDNSEPTTISYLTDLAYGAFIGTVDTDSVEWETINEMEKIHWFKVTIVKNVFGGFTEGETIWVALTGESPYGPTKTFTKNERILVYGEQALTDISKSHPDGWGIIGNSAIFRYTGASGPAGEPPEQYLEVKSHGPIPLTTEAAAIAATQERISGQGITPETKNTNPDHPVPTTPNSPLPQ